MSKTKNKPAPLERQLEKPKKLDSSVIRDARYNKLEKILTLQFKRNGRQYEFYGVPVRVSNGLLESDSPGEYFNSRIMGVFDYKEI